MKRLLIYIIYDYNIALRTEWDSTHVLGLSPRELAADWLNIWLSLPTLAAAAALSEYCQGGGGPAQRGQNSTANTQRIYSQVCVAYPVGDPATTPNYIKPNQARQFPTKFYQPKLAGFAISSFGL